MTVTTTQVPAPPFQGDGGSMLTFSAQGAGTSNSTNQENAPFPHQPARGIVLGVNITAISGTSPTLTVTLQGYDSASGQYYTLLASAALNATGFTALTIFPGATAVANTTANMGLPAIWNIKAVIGGTSPSVTATIGASYIY